MDKGLLKEFKELREKVNSLLKSKDKNTSNNNIGSHDKDRLKSKVVDVNWTPFLNNDSINSQMPLILDGPRFIDEREEEYNRLMEINSVLPSTTTITAPIVQPPSYDEVDFADI